jgi:hypothetical protein
MFFNILILKLEYVELSNPIPKHKLLRRVEHSFLKGLFYTANGQVAEYWENAELRKSNYVRNGSPFEKSEPW